ncbi:hypothetical protein DFJ77DRAFT_438688 [Powellomyces hirtus]|nr:hypothetical protein DFJ77DRAFT_438688 [Powellomyces hirtus]
MPSSPTPASSMPLPSSAKGPIPTFSHTTKNSWVFTEYQTLYENPTCKRDPQKWDVNAEIWARHQACIFIEKLSSNFSITGLGLPSELINTAKILLHRVFMRVPIQKTHRWELCASIIFLCSKLGENRYFRKLDHVAYTCAAAMKKMSPTTQERQLWEKRIRSNETLVMRLVEGDLVPTLPHALARDIVSKFGGSETLQASVKKCCNEALITSLAVRATPAQIAQAAVILGCFKTKQTLTRNGKPWWEFQSNKVNLANRIAFAQEISTARIMAKVFDIIVIRKEQLAKQGKGPRSAQTKNNVRPGTRGSEKPTNLPMTPSPTSPSKTPVNKEVTPGPQRTRPTVHRHNPIGRPAPSSSKRDEAKVKSASVKSAPVPAPAVDMQLAAVPAPPPNLSTAPPPRDRHRPERANPPGSVRHNPIRRPA